MMDEHSFDATYAQMLDGELARVLRGRRNLVPEARLALDREIQKRQLDPEKLRKRRPRDPEKRRPPTVLEKRLGKKRLRWPQSIALMAASAMLFLVLDRFGAARYFWPLFITIMIPVSTIWGFRELWPRPWFWWTLVAIVTAHVVFFSLVPWPWGTRWVPGLSIAGLVTLESIPIFALIWRLEKRWNRLQRRRSKVRVKEP